MKVSRDDVNQFLTLLSDSTEFNVDITLMETVATDPSEVVIRGLQVVLQNWLDGMTDDGIPVDRMTYD